MATVIKNKSNKRGFVLIVTLVFILIFTITAIAYVGMMMNEARAARQQRDSTKAFYLAEAGARWSIYDKRGGGSGNTTGLQSLNGRGQYEVTFASNTITARGYFPSKTDYDAGRGSKRTIEVNVTVATPSGFFDNAIVGAGKVELKDSFAITGNITYGTIFEATGEGTYDADNCTQSDAVNPLPHLDFQQLRDMAESQIKANGQDNIYTYDDLEDEKTFPGSFWFTRADDGVDNDNDGTTDEDDEWVPNIIYVETDLELKEDIGTIGGFFVVVGNVLTDPSGLGSIEIDGDGTIDGCIYTLGKFEINGGDSGGIVIDGGIWAGQTDPGTEVKGNSTITYNSVYMQALSGLGIDYKLQIVSWRELPGS